MNKKIARLRRAKKTRMKIRELSQVRLCVYKTPRHMYAQVISADSLKVLFGISTLSKEIKEKVKYTGNVDAAKLIGESIAKKAIAAGIKKIAFDKSGFKYHGRVKALADAARAAGLEF